MLIKKFNKMKKIITWLIAALLTLTILPVQAIPAIKDNPTSVPVTKPVKETTEAEKAEAKALLNRLNEIKAMDKSNLKMNEKKKLHKEVRTIKRKLKDISGGLYISAGTLIIILILLVILT